MPRRASTFADKQYTLKLYSSALCPQCHRIRLVLSEKELDYKNYNVDALNTPPELAELNPYNSVPTLVDRDVVLYESRIILEYLDERYPHPSLIPGEPIVRAKFRQAMYHIEVDWYNQLKKLSSPSPRIADSAKKIMYEMLISNAHLFKTHRYFWSDDFTLLDCSLAPILWRLPSFDIAMPKRSNHPIRQYTKRIFERPSFRKSLSDEEADIGRKR